MLLRALTDLKPDYVAVALDRPARPSGTSSTKPTRHSAPQRRTICATSSTGCVTW